MSKEKRIIKSVSDIIHKFLNGDIYTNLRMENLVNSLIYKKIELGVSVNGRIDILQIVDKGKRILQNISGPSLPDIQKN